MPSPQGNSKPEKNRIEAYAQRPEAGNATTRIPPTGTKGVQQTERRDESKAKRYLSVTKANIHELQDIEPTIYTS